MELDDLKQTWKQTENKQHLKNENIMELIQQKSSGPIAALKTQFRKQMAFVTIIAIAISITNLVDTSKFTNIFFVSYMLFCVGMASFYYFNYRLVRKMETMDGMVKSNLEQQVEVLELRLKRQIIALRLVMIFFIVLCEVLPYFQHGRMIDKWHSLSPVLRIAVYSLLLVMQYFTTRSMSKRKFGSHLSYLKELIREMH